MNRRLTLDELGRLLVDWDEECEPEPITMEDLRKAQEHVSKVFRQAQEDLIYNAFHPGSPIIEGTFHVIDRTETEGDSQGSLCGPNPER